MTIKYSMTPIASGTRLRTDHNTFAPVITSYGVTALVQGDILWEAPADGNEVKKGDRWLHVTHVDNLLLPQAGWMAITHKGVPICENLGEVPDVPPPPPPPTPVFPESFTLVDPSGAKAEYKFVRVLE